VSVISLPYQVLSSGGVSSPGDVRARRTATVGSDTATNQRIALRGVKCSSPAATASQAEQGKRPPLHEN
jgi:hypothetical protein